MRFRGRALSRDQHVLRPLQRCELVTTLLGTRHGSRRGGRAQCGVQGLSLLPRRIIFPLLSDRQTNQAACEIAGRGPRFQSCGGVLIEGIYQKGRQVRSDETYTAMYGIHNRFIAPEPSFFTSPALCQPVTCGWGDTALSAHGGAAGQQNQGQSWPSDNALQDFPARGKPNCEAKHDAALEAARAQLDATKEEFWRRL